MGDCGGQDVLSNSKPIVCKDKTSNNKLKALMLQNPLIIASLKGMKWTGLCG